MHKSQCPLSSCRVFRAEVNGQTDAILRIRRLPRSHSTYPCDHTSPGNRGYHTLQHPCQLDAIFAGLRTILLFYVLFWPENILIIFWRDHSPRNPLQPQILRRRTTVGTVKAPHSSHGTEHSILCLCFSSKRWSSPPSPRVCNYI